MWIVLAAAGCGFLANCWIRANKNKDPIDDGNLKPRLRTRNAPNSCQVENYANPKKFGINGGAFSSLSSEKEQTNASSKSQLMEIEVAHVNINPGLANDKDRSGKRISQQDILQESHFGENSDMLANIYVGEFGFGSKYESQKRGSSACRERARVLRAAINKPMSSLESCLIGYEISDCSCVSCGRRRQRPLLVTDGSKIVNRGAGISPLLLPIPITDYGLPCHNDINSDEPGPVPLTGLPSLRKCSQSSSNAGMTKRRKTCRYNTSTLSAFESNKHFPLQGSSSFVFSIINIASLESNQVFKKLLYVLSTDLMCCIISLFSGNSIFLI